MVLFVLHECNKIIVFIYLCWKEYVDDPDPLHPLRRTGVDTLEVIELQKYSEEGDTFVITSWPTVKQPQGFSATVEMVLSPAGKGEGCTISTTIILECKAAVWGVQGT